METVHPAFSTSDLDVKRRRHTTLKRLDFVRAYTEYYWSKANTIASMVCPFPTSREATFPSLCPILPWKTFIVTQICSLADMADLVICTSSPLSSLAQLDC